MNTVIAFDRIPKRPTLRLASTTTRDDLTTTERQRHRGPALPCSQSAHLLSLYDAFLEAERAYSAFCWRNGVCFDASVTVDTAPHHLKHILSDQAEHDRLLSICIEAREAIAAEGASDSCAAIHILMTINLTLVLWDLVSNGDVTGDDSEHHYFEHAEFWTSHIVNAWHDARWLAGLQDDPRFQSKFILSNAGLQET